MFKPICNFFNSYFNALKKLIGLTGGLVVFDWLTFVLFFCTLIICVTLGRNNIIMQLASNDKNFKWKLICFVLAFCVVAFFLGKCYGEFDFVRRFLRD